MNQPEKTPFPLHEEEKSPRKKLFILFSLILFLLVIIYFLNRGENFSRSTDNSLSTQPSVISEVRETNATSQTARKSTSRQTTTRATTSKQTTSRTTTATTTEEVNLEQKAEEALAMVEDDIDGYAEIHYEIENDAVIFYAQPIGEADLALRMLPFIKNTQQFRDAWTYIEEQILISSKRLVDEEEISHKLILIDPRDGETVLLEAENGKITSNSIRKNIGPN